MISSFLFQVTVDSINYITHLEVKCNLLINQRIVIIVVTIKS